MVQDKTIILPITDRKNFSEPTLDFFYLFPEKFKNRVSLQIEYFMMLKIENITDECLCCHSQGVLCSPSMMSHPNNFSDTLSDAAAQSRSQKVQVYSSNRSPWEWESCCEDGKIYVLL